MGTEGVCQAGDSHKNQEAAKGFTAGPNFLLSPHLLGFSINLQLEAAKETGKE